MDNKSITLIVVAVAAVAVVYLVYFASPPPEPPPPVSCAEGEFVRSANDCWESSDSPDNCGKTGLDNGCCPLEEQCWEGEACYTTEQALDIWPYYLCSDGKWDWCDFGDECDTRDGYYCDGRRWVEGTLRDCMLKTCIEGQFVRSANDCWENDDSLEQCGRIGADYGCCPNENQCWESGKCYTAEEALTVWPYYLCHEAKWDWCDLDDHCNTRGEYYCYDEKWVKGTSPEDCVETPPNGNGNGDCPEGQYYRGEWDCWEGGDDPNCNAGEYEHGCCLNATDCFFGGSCYSSSSQLAEGSDWFCFEGKWDKCSLEQQCGQRGSYYCYNNAWQAEKPALCG